MSVCKISIYERAFWKRNLHVYGEGTRFSVSWKSLVDGVSEQEKYLFLGSLGSDFAYRLVYQVSSRLQCLDSKLCGACLIFFGCRLAKILDTNSIMDYFTWDFRLNDEFIYNYIKRRLWIVKTIQEDSVQRQVHLRSDQGKL